MSRRRGVHQGVSYGKLKHALSCEPEGDAGAGHRSESDDGDRAILGNSEEKGGDAFSRMRALTRASSEDSFLRHPHSHSSALQEVELQVAREANEKKELDEVNGENVGV